jgi:hypothetical protein
MEPEDDFGFEERKQYQPSRSPVSNRSDGSSDYFTVRDNLSGLGKFGFNSGLTREERIKRLQSEIDSLKKQLSAK